MKKFIPAATLVVLTTSIFNCFAKSNIRWDNIEISYINNESDNFANSKFEGVNFSLIKKIPDDLPLSNFFFQIDYLTGQLEQKDFSRINTEGDSNTFMFGVGYQYSLTDNLDIFTSYGIGKQDNSITNSDEIVALYPQFQQFKAIDNDINRFTLGLRYMLTNKLEIGTEIEIAKYTRDTSTYSSKRAYIAGSALYEFKENLVVGFEYAYDSAESNIFKVSSRYYF